MLRILQPFLLVAAVAVWADSSADERIPVALIRIPDSIETVFVAETSAARFHRFEQSEHGLVHSGSFYMSIGEEGPGKNRSGDKRTPLGAYFVTEQLDTSQLHEKYGTTAFPLDYPNAWDQRSDRDGDGIWIHGVHPQGGPRPERDTDGCIALPNKDLKSMLPGFRENLTPVLIMTSVEWSDAKATIAIRAELEALVGRWSGARANGDLFTYLSLYDDDFRRWEMDKQEWSSFYLQTSSQNPPREAAVSDLMLLAYPDEKELYLSRFQLTPVDNKRAIAVTVRLYWRRDANGALKIIVEDSG